MAPSRASRPLHAIFNLYLRLLPIYHFINLLLALLLTLSSTPSAPLSQLWSAFAIYIVCTSLASPLLHLGIHYYQPAYIASTDLSANHALALPSKLGALFVVERAAVAQQGVMMGLRIAIPGLVICWASGWAERWCLETWESVAREEESAERDEEEGLLEGEGRSFTEERAAETDVMGTGSMPPPTHRSRLLPLLYLLKNIISALLTFSDLPSLLFGRPTWLSLPFIRSSLLAAALLPSLLSIPTTLLAHLSSSPLDPILSPPFFPLSYLPLLRLLGFSAPLLLGFPSEAQRLLSGTAVRGLSLGAWAGISAVVGLGVMEVLSFQGREGMERAEPGKWERDEEESGSQELFLMRDRRGHESSESRDSLDEGRRDRRIVEHEADEVDALEFSDAPDAAVVSRGA